MVQKRPADCFPKADIEDYRALVKEHNKSSSTAGTELRRKAEQQLRVKTAVRKVELSEVEKQRLMHELEVHQIELEMQNEELRKSKDEVEELLGKYSDLYDFAPVGYATLDREGAFRAVNLACADLLGVDRSRLIGQRLRQFVSSEASPAFFSFLEKVFSRQEPVSCELALLANGKDPLFVQVEAGACSSGLECRIAIINISERKKLEKKLESLRTDLARRATELETVNSELEAFNYTVSHDLRQPLTTINSYCQALLQELQSGQSPELVEQYANRIYDSTLQMSLLIDSFLKFSHLSHAEVCREQVDVSSIATILTVERNLAEPKRQVRFQIEEGLTANADSGLLVIILDNLIGNAWKYTCKQKEAVIEIGQTWNEDKQIFYVKDNGIGFDMAAAENIFMPFQRLPGTVVGGHGIGLATVQRAVQRHGGTIWTESKTGRGASFFFTLSAD